MQNFKANNFEKTTMGQECIVGELFLLFCAIPRSNCTPITTVDSRISEHTILARMLATSGAGSRFSEQLAYSRTNGPCSIGRVCFCYSHMHHQFSSWSSKELVNIPSNQILREIMQSCTGNKLLCDKKCGILVRSVIRL